MLACALSSAALGGVPGRKAAGRTKARQRMQRSPVTSRTVPSPYIPDGPLGPLRLSWIIFASSPNPLMDGPNALLAAAGITAVSGARSLPPS